MPTYYFPVVVSGKGSSVKDAWDAIRYSDVKLRSNPPDKVTYQLERGDENDQEFIDGECPATQDDHAWMELSDCKSIICKGCGVSCSKYDDPDDDDNTAWPVNLTSILQNEAVKPYGLS